MKRIAILLIITFAIGNCRAQRATETSYDLKINGCKERVLVQSTDTVNNPILLYLHGGPGSSLMLYSYLFSNKIRKHFTFVNWDMRGTALSYHEGIDTTLVSEKQIADDAIYLIRYLIKRYHHKKIYILGHSFGSVLGMHLVDHYPDLFYAYIGVGQVMDFNKSVAIEYKWLHKTLIEANDTAGLKRIEQKHFPYIDLITKYGGHHRLSINLDSVIMKSPYYFDGYLDLLKKGKHFSATYVGRNPKYFKKPYEIKNTNVPLYFFEGKNDHVTACAPELVEDYCKMVKAPIAKIIWFENTAHYVPVEEPEKFQNGLIKVLSETKKD